MKVSEWRPDMPALSDATSIAVNVIPLTSESYGPINSLASYSSTALDGPCIGLVAVQDTDLSVRIVAGTADKLYFMVAGSTAWADVSGTSYSTASGDSWHFEIYSRIILTTNFADPIQSYVMGSSTVFANLSADAPMARCICTPKNFVMVGNTYDGVGGLAPGRLWWSASGDPTSWPTPGSALAQQTQSDYQDFQGSYGEITGLVDSLANADVAIWFRHAIWRGVYSGPPDVFDFFPIENVRGCPCPNGIVPLGPLAYYPGEDGFYVFDGSQSIPIGANKFDKWFWATVNQGYLWNVIGVADVLNRAIIWIFPSTAASDGIPDTALIYRWDIQRGSYAAVSAEWISRLLSFGVTLDGFSALGFTDLDTIPYSLDSRVWIGGTLQLGAVDVSHKLAFFTGQSLAAQIGTSENQFTQGRLSWFSSARPLVELVTGTPTISVGARNNLYDPIVYNDPVSPDSMGECPQRSDARYHTAILAMQAGDAWSEISGIDPTVQPSGER